MKPGWEVRTLADVSNVVNGGTPSSSVPAYWDGGVNWLTPKDMGKMQGRYIDATPRTISEVGLNNSSARIVPSNSVILSTRAPIGHLAVNTSPMAFNQGCRGLVPKAQLETNYLYYFLLFNKVALDELGTGTTFKELSSGSLKGFRIPLPPLEEQQRIVAILDEAFEGLDRARANAEVNLQNTKDLFESAMNLAFTVNSETWPKGPLDQLVEKDCSLSYGIVQPGDEVVDGQPIVRPTDLGARTITLNGLKKIDPKRAKGYARTELKGREILLCVRGSTGVVGLASEELIGANVTRGIVPIRFDRNRIDQQFGFYQFLSKHVQDQIKAGTYGAALMQINIRDLRQMNLFAPPLDQQEAIVQQLDSLSEEFNRLMENYTEKASDLDDLRQSLLQKAFAGELT